MSLCATALVTRGFIGCYPLEGVMTSCATPEVVAVDSTIPHTSVVGHSPPVESPPILFAGGDVVSQVKSAVASTPSATVTPSKIIGTEDLRPKVVKASKE